MANFLKEMTTLFTLHTYNKDTIVDDCKSSFYYPLMLKAPQIWSSLTVFATLLVYDNSKIFLVIFMNSLTNSVQVLKIFAFKTYLAICNFFRDFEPFVL